MTVMAISTARNNAELIAQAAELGYIGEHVLDATYGLGRFWKIHRPATMVTNDSDPERMSGWSYDFRAFPEDWAFDTVVFDPPYKLNGTGGSHPSDEAYGVATSGVSRDTKLALAVDGATECIRVLKVGGHLLWKCQDQVEGGRVRWQTRIFADHAESLGCELVDMLHLPSYRPQPAGTTQQHARRNYSTLLVLRKLDARPPVAGSAPGLFDGAAAGEELEQLIVDFIAFRPLQYAADARELARAIVASLPANDLAVVSTDQIGVSS